MKNLIEDKGEFMKIKKIENNIVSPDLKIDRKIYLSIWRRSTRMDVTKDYTKIKL